MPKRIEICGPIASGKTTLAKLLEKHGYEAVYERFEDNPFLKAFYQDGGLDNTFETEVVFILLHYNLIKQKKYEGTLVSDYSLLQDYCYGMQNLAGDGQAIFLKLHAYLNRMVPKADRIIYLKCGVDCLKERILKRSRNMEQHISKDYLKKSIEVMDYYLQQRKDVTVIDSEKNDFTGKDQELVLEWLGVKIDGRIL